MSANAIETLREWAEHDYGDWMLTSKGAERLAEIGDALAAVEALLEAVNDVIATTCITEDGTFVSEGAARNLIAARRRVETGQ